MVHTVCRLHNKTRNSKAGDTLQHHSKFNIYSAWHLPCAYQQTIDQFRSARSPLLTNVKQTPPPPGQTEEENKCQQATYKNCNLYCFLGGVTTSFSTHWRKSTWDLTDEWLKVPLDPYVMLLGFLEKQVEEQGSVFNLLCVKSCKIVLTKNWWLPIITDLKGWSDKVLK